MSLHNVKLESSSTIPASNVEIHLVILKNHPKADHPNSYFIPPLQRSYRPRHEHFLSQLSKIGPNYLCGTSAPVIRQLSLWISTSLKQTPFFRSPPTPFRALRRPLVNHSTSARHGIAIDIFQYIRRFPRTRLSRTRFTCTLGRTVVLAGYTRLHSSSRLLLTPLNV